MHIELMVSASAVFECKPDLNGTNPNNLASFAIPVTPRGVAYLQDMQACANNAGGQSVMTLAFIGAPCPWAYSSGFAATQLGNNLGPYAVSQTAAASGQCTILHPTTMETDKRHPVVIWGHGTNIPIGLYINVLNNFASYGFVVAVANTGNAGAGEEMIDCLDELLADSQNPASKFHRKLNPYRIAATGQSQGGGGAMMAGRDPRIAVTVPFEPWIGPIQGVTRFDVNSIVQQRGPMLLLSGALDTIAVPAIHQKPVFDNTNVPVLWATETTGTHQNVDFMGRAAATPFLRWQLMQDTAAANVFTGPCTLCTHPNFTVQKRNGFP